MPEEPCFVDHSKDFYCTLAQIPPRDRLGFLKYMGMVDKLRFRAVDYEIWVDQGRMEEEFDTDPAVPEPHEPEPR